VAVNATAIAEARLESELFGHTSTCASSPPPIAIWPPPPATAACRRNQLH
jgi:hypothetical protein